MAAKKVSELRMNNWNIPERLEKEIIKRDQVCVYCGVEFDSSNESRKNHASWEHIINDASIVTRENIAKCCASCNSSKGTKELSDWLQTDYCKKKGINNNTVAEIVKKALKNH